MKIDKELLKGMTEYVGRYLVVVAIFLWAVQPFVSTIEAWFEDFAESMDSLLQSIADFFNNDFGRGLGVGVWLTFIFAVVIPKLVLGRRYNW